MESRRTRLPLPIIPIVTQCEEDKDAPSTYPSRGGTNGVSSEDKIIDQVQQGGDEEVQIVCIRKKKKRLKLMKESNQTRSEREKIRKDQRKLFKKMRQGSEISELMCNPQNGEFDMMRYRNNVLNAKVKYTREAVLDADNIETISTKGKRQVDSIVNIPRYDATNLVKKLRQKLQNASASSSSTSRHHPPPSLDWKCFGEAVGSMFNTVPSHISFLSGPLEHQYIPKVRAQRIKQSTDPDAQAVVVREARQDNPKKKHHTSSSCSDIQTHIKVLHKTLKQECKKRRQETANEVQEWIDTQGLDYESLDKKDRLEINEKVSEGGKVCMAKLLFNPQSFTQTVENLSNLSHLVKNGGAAVGVRTREECEALGLEGCKPGPWVKKVSQVHDKIEEGSNTAGSTKTQTIVALNLRDWKAICETFQVESSLVPHRKSSNPREHKSRN